jgi:hypothetical protein
MAALCLASIAHSAPRHGVFSTGVSCPYAVDNGCLYSTTYVASPFFQDTAFAYNHSTSGQLPTDCVNSTTCTINTNAITNVTALWHKANANIPYWDYPIGSANPATLTPITSFPGDATCSYSATGSYPGGFPALVCQQNASTPATYTISGYDFSNLGGGTGTGCAQLFINGSNSANAVGGNTTYVLQNDYFKAVGSCFSGSDSTAGTLIFGRGSGTHNLARLVMNNVTCDGNYNNAPDTNPDSFTGYISGTTLTVVTGSATYGTTLTGGGVLAGTYLNGGSNPTWTVFPSQTVGSAGSPVAFTGHKNAETGRINCVQPEASVTVNYSLFKNFGHIPFFGNMYGDVVLNYNAFIDFCQSGGNLCHGEVYEQLNTTDTNINATHIGNVITVPSIQNVNLQTTTPFYLSSGQSATRGYNNLYIQNNLVIMNRMNCANAGPYTPANPCGATGNGSLVQISGYALFGIEGTSVNAATISGNVVDGVGAYVCIGNGVKSPADFTGATIGVLSAGQNLTFSTAPTGYSPSARDIILPGMHISDTKAADLSAGWIDSNIVSFTGASAPIYQNSASACAAGGGVPGQAGGGGCGSMLLAQVEPVVNLDPAYIYVGAGWNTFNWSNNWSVGGNYGVSARSYASPGNGTWTASQVNCP